MCVHLSQELCKDGAEADSSPQLLVDFWEALLVASSHEAIIQELLFRLTSVYIDRITRRDRAGVKALKTAEDLVSRIKHPHIAGIESAGLHLVIARARVF